MLKRRIGEGSQHCTLRPKSQQIATPLSPFASRLVLFPIRMQRSDVASAVGNGTASVFVGLSLAWAISLNKRFLALSDRVVEELCFSLTHRD